MATCGIGHPSSFNCTVCPAKFFPPPPPPPPPPQAHFNERGELIPYSIVPTSLISTRFPTNTTAFLPKTIEMLEEFDVDLELEYPDDEPQQAETRPNSSSVGPKIAIVAPKPLATPQSAKSKVISMLCPTDGCNGITRMPGRRCLSCIHNSWSKLRATQVVGGQPTAIEPLLKPPKSLLRKGVNSGATEVKPKRKKKNLNVRLLVNVPGSDKPEIVVLDKPVVETVGYKLTLPDSESWSGGGWDSDLTDLTSDDDQTQVQPVVEPPRTPFKIRIPARSPTKPPKPTLDCPSDTLPPVPAAQSNFQQRHCTIARCRAPLPPITVYRWKCCTSCRTHYRQYQRDRLQGLRDTVAATLTLPLASRSTSQEHSSPRTPDRTLEMAKEVEDHSKNLADVESSQSTLNMSGEAQLARFPELYVPQARVCPTCDHILPGQKEYSLELCVVCTRRGQLKVNENLKNVLVYPAIPVRQPGRCKYVDCGSLMPDVGIQECQQCIRRMRKLPGRPPVRKKSCKTPPPTPTPPPKSIATKPDEEGRSNKKRKSFSPYPVYQSRDAVIKDFGARFQGFIRAQSFYTVMRSGGLTSPTMFDFSGEYSVVAADLDVIGRRPLAEAHARNVKNDIERVCGIQFSATSWVSILGSPRGVVNRFACAHVVDVPVSRHLTSPPKTMQGELEVAILPDDSHKYFPGEKTIIRFRLVG
ncbi:hypothetical protein MIND_00316700 [Mycena indigotica]|uniref:Uncharacterized protein n=1 Tax=Mycena indigotica TaxID=2126181 RepID=A0A8H6WEH0_9AGAR|nr:uncharacterized protein MIND_00316700 [Mycena indigotica]KAF7309459.1 hypothetical protein MIND_00316700 [Mycena indigotica]